MPLNLTKKYDQLLDVGQYNEYQRKESLMRIFKRDIEENPNFKFRLKQIRPTKKEGESPMQTLYHHLTTRGDKDENGKKTGPRTFEMVRSIRLHWIKPHVDETTKSDVVVFSYEDRVDGKDVVRTYIYNKTNDYVLILEPQRSKLDYYLLTAYYLNEPGGKKQIEKKLKKKLHEIH